jgi:hypothetical protein
VVQPRLGCAVPVEQLSQISLPSQDHDAGVEMPFLVLDFITTVFNGTLTVQSARFLTAQATDSVSRSRDEITVETPSPRMLIPYRASAISMVRF